MAPRIRTVIGTAGSGKTTFGIALLQQKLNEGLSWRQVGYTSFSRAACGEAARRAAEICGEDASYLQKNGSYATLHALALRAIDIDRKAILDLESADGRKFIQQACGSAPDAREKGTLAERVSIALSLWDLHRARLGRSVSDIAGILRHDRGGVESVPPLTPDRKSLTHNELRRSDGGVGDDGDASISPMASPFFAAFSASKTLFSLFLSRIENFGSENKYARKNFDSEDISDPFGVPCFKNSYRRIVKPAPDQIVTSGALRPQSDEVEIPVDVTTGYHNSCEWGAATSPMLQSPFREVIESFENHKQLYGRLDFTDILMRFLGVSVDANLELAVTYESPAVDNGLQCLISDEHQDVSPLLACVAEKLSENAQEAILLGDPYQECYGFNGASGSILRAYSACADSHGMSTLLNVSYRNPSEILEWGEAILNEDPLYVPRQPVSAAWEDESRQSIREGSATLVKWEDFLSYLPELACSDVLVLSRTWFTLLPVKERLDSLGVPWRSCQEKQSSRWECPAKIAYTIALRDLERGELISEQDWRRITDTLPQKLDGIDLFVRGTKAKWKKAVCSPVNSHGIHQIHEWGATEAFIDFVLLGHWRREMPALLDSAIEKYGLDVVRKPRIRLGSVHSVKGLEARNVFCLSASTARASGDEADFNEEICLKYVAITRASKNYRLVVNVNDIARSKPQFWAAPKGYWEFDSEPPQGHFREPEAEKPKDDGYFEPVRSEDPSEDPEMDWEFGI